MTLPLIGLTSSPSPACNDPWPYRYVFKHVNFRDAYVRQDAYSQPGVPLAPLLPTM
mgnify:CR=1 FL=1